MGWAAREERAAERKHAAALDSAGGPSSAASRLSERAQLNSKAPSFLPSDAAPDAEGRTKLRSGAPSFAPLMFMPAGEVAAAWQRYFERSARTCERHGAVEDDKAYFF